MATGAQPDAITLPSVLREDAVIARVLLAWGVLAGIGVGLMNVGGSSGHLIALGDAVTRPFVIGGLVNALLYVIARGIALSRQ